MKAKHARQSWEISEGTKALRARVERMYPKQKHAWQSAGVRIFEKTSAMARLSKRLGVHVRTFLSWCMGAKPQFEMRWMLADRFKIPMSAWTAKRFVQRRRWIDETGTQCGSLAVQGVAPRRPGDHGMHFMCRCSLCGASVRLAGTVIRRRRRAKQPAACAMCNRARRVADRLRDSRVQRHRA